MGGNRELELLFDERPCVPKSDFRTTCHQSCLDKWQRDWDHTYDNKLQEVKPFVHSQKSSVHPVHCDKIVLT
jgi:hypothetical protein